MSEFPQCDYYVVILDEDDDFQVNGLAQQIDYVVFNEFDDALDQIAARLRYMTETDSEVEHLADVRVVGFDFIDRSDPRWHHVAQESKAATLVPYFDEESETVRFREYVKP